jgi:hypothetical protein
MGYYSLEGSKQSKSRVHLRLISSTCVFSVPTLNIWRWDVDRGTLETGKVLRFILVNSWLCGSTTTLSFMVGEGDYLEHTAQEQEERRMTMIDFKFPRGLKNSVTTFQPAVRQPTAINLINGPTRSPIRTPSMTTRSSGLAIGKIWIAKHEDVTSYP